MEGEMNERTKRRIVERKIVEKLLQGIGHLF
jgi:hypothetical protein